MLNRLLAQGVNSSVPVAEGFLEFYSNLFMVQKPNGDVCPILDLKNLNKFLKVQSFDMKLICLVVALLQQADFLASVDIRGAYLQVLVFPAHQKFLQFFDRESALLLSGQALWPRHCSLGFYKSVSPSAELVKGPESVHPGISR